MGPDSAAIGPGPGRAWIRRRSHPLSCRRFHSVTAGTAGPGSDKYPFSNDATRRLRSTETRPSPPPEERARLWRSAQIEPLFPALFQLFSSFFQIFPAFFQLFLFWPACTPLGCESTRAAPESGLLPPLGERKACELVRGWGKRGCSLWTRDSSVRCPGSEFEKTSCPCCVPRSRSRITFVLCLPCVTQGLSTVGARGHASFSSFSTSGPSVAVRGGLQLGGVAASSMSAFFLAREASWGAPPWRCGAGFNSEMSLRGRCNFLGPSQANLRRDENSGRRRTRGEGLRSKKKKKLGGRGSGP